MRLYRRTKKKRSADALERLSPSYMIPAHMIEMEQWPVTPSGKLDRNALPAPDGAADEETYTAPRNVTEMKLAQLWRTC
ncbi:hypothetical protein KQR57_22305 [Bacillus inaquosorum]|nr:hypothetical protein [Bacillus inaquosorum]